MTGSFVQLCCCSVWFCNFWEFCNQTNSRDHMTTHTFLTHPEIQHIQFLQFMITESISGCTRKTTDLCLYLFSDSVIHVLKKLFSCIWSKKKILLISALAKITLPDACPWWRLLFIYQFSPRLTRTWLAATALLLAPRLQYADAKFPN